MALNSTISFSSLKPFTSFTGNAFDEDFYTDIPHDWLIVIADIEDSTRAVEDGKYEQVNYVGAACITALNNAMPELDFPKVFGGDGAHAVVPPDNLPVVIKAMQQMTHWSQRQFGLRLITGIVPMYDVVSSGGHLSAGKMRSSTGVDIAMFRGNGLDIAESMVKKDTTDRYRLTSATSNTPDLTDLSCRWSPITPTRDHMLCIIVSAHSDTPGSADNTLSSVVHLINNIVTLDSSDTMPASADKLKFKLRLTAMRKEIASVRGSLWKRVLSVLGIHMFARALFAFSMRVGNFDAEQYRSEIAGNSDYIKVAGSVKMVLDCTSSQADDIEILLEQQYQSQQLVYGVYRAKKALMTCITPDINSGNHIHYIDGSDGGLWQAASALKQRLAEVGGNNR